MEETSEYKKPISMRVSNEGLDLMDALAKKLGVSRTSITEIAIRRMAEQEGVSGVTPAVTRKTTTPKN